MSALACEIFWLRCCTVVPEVAEPGFGGPMTPQMFVAQDQHREPGTKHGAKPVDPPTLPCHRGDLDLLHQSKVIPRSSRQAQ